MSSACPSCPCLGKLGLDNLTAFITTSYLNLSSLSEDALSLQPEGHPVQFYARTGRP